MSDKRRATGEGAAPLNHADAEALISARLDGPLDPALNRELQAHLATCESCRAFANQMDVMATAMRDLPVLPPSAAVTRRVRSEIRGGGSPVRRFSNWIMTSKAAPATALAGAAVALALVSASVFGTIGDDDNNNQRVSAPNFAASDTSTGTAGGDAAYVTTSESDEAAGSQPTGAGMPNVQVTRPSETVPAESSTDESTGATGGGVTATADGGGAGDDRGGPDVAMVTGTEAPAPTQSGAQSTDETAAGSNEAPADTTEPADQTDQNGSGSTGNGGNAALTGPVGGGNDQSTAPATDNAEPTPTSQGGDDTVVMAAIAEESPAATETPEPSATPTEEPTNTPEPTETPEPTKTPEPTETPTPEPTNTPEPTDTPEPTNTPKATATPTAEASPTPEEATSAPEPTSTPEATQPPIVPHDGETDTADVDASDEVAPTTSASGAESAASGSATDEAGSGDSPQIQSREDDTEAADTSGDAQGGDAEQASDEGIGAAGQTAPAGEETATENATVEETAAAEIGPATFSELAPNGAVPVPGVLLPSGSGYYAVEQAGLVSIIASDGTLLLGSQWAYNPVWSSDGQTLYAANGAISEGAADINAWSAATGGASFVTTGGAINTPVGVADGGLYFIRYQPGFDPSLQLIFYSGEESVVWSSSGYALTGQGMYLHGGLAYVPTDQGWIAIPTGGGEESVIGGSGDGVYDIVISPFDGQVAFVAGGTIYIAPDGSPASATPVGDLGNGGFAWTPYGLAIASGGQVTIVAGGGAVTVVEGGGDLTAPIWTDAGLQIADMAEGGAARLLPADEIAAALAG